MLQVQFRTNVGSRDAFRFGIDHKECTYGAVVDLADDVAEAVVRTGFAVLLTEKPSTRSAKKAERVKTVPPKVDTKPAEVDVKTADTEDADD